MSTRRKLVAAMGAASLAAWIGAALTAVAVVTWWGIHPAEALLTIIVALAASIGAGTVAAAFLCFTVPSALAAFQYGRANPYPKQRHLRAVPDDLTPQTAGHE